MLPLPSSLTIFKNIKIGGRKRQEKRKVRENILPVVDEGPAVELLLVVAEPEPEVVDCPPKEVLTQQKGKEGERDRKGKEGEKEKEEGRREKKRRGLTTTNIARGNHKTVLVACRIVGQCVGFWGYRATWPIVICHGVS